MVQSKSSKGAVARVFISRRYNRRHKSRRWNTPYVNAESRPAGRPAETVEGGVHPRNAGIYSRHHAVSSVLAQFAACPPITGLVGA